MSAEKETGGQAFPRAAAQLNVGYVAEQKGMTLRDYFAAKAMQSLLGKDTWVQSDPEMFARDAYTIADAMLEARK